MVVQNLYFFDKNGKSLNLSYNSELGIWEGTLYFEPLSLFLFDNENIFMLEKEEEGDEYFFPMLTSTQSISFEWETVENSNEFFVYDVNKDTVLKNYFIQKLESKEIGYFDIYQTNIGPLNVKAPLQFNLY